MSLYCMCCVFDSVCELCGKTMCLGVDAILLCLVWVDVLCWIDHVWSSKECVCCACDPRVHLRVLPMFC